MAIFQYIIRFVVLVFFQILILNNIHFLGIANPYLYVMFLLGFPIGFSRPLFLTIAFLLGFCIDLFSGTIGIHTFATLTTAFVAMKTISLFSPRDDVRNNEIVIPSMRTFGVAMYCRYSILVVVVHHLLLFLMESFSFEHFGLLLLRIIFSSIFTISLLLGLKWFQYRNKN